MASDYIRRIRYDDERIFVNDRGIFQEVRREPPPPTKPDGENIRQMFSTTYQGKDIRSGFTVDTIDEVKTILIVYDSGAAGSALTTTVGDMPGEGAVMMLTQDALRGSSKFMKTLLSNVDRWYLGEMTDFDKQFGREKPKAPLPHYGQGWDYDGPGAWHKASMSIERRGDGRLHVNIHRAHTSDCETRMAATLKRLPDFLRSQHAFTWKADENGRFLIPADFFTTIGGILGYPAGPDKLGADFFAKSMVDMEGDWRLTYDAKPFSFENERCRVVIGWTNYRRLDARKWQQLRAKHPEDEKLSFALTEAGLSGPAERDHRFKTWFNAIGLDVGIYPKTPADESYAIEAGGQIRAAYGHLPRAYKE